ncbi:MarR family transcriptional regulator [Halopelagius longus]|uniref:MarR family transcriptional regulator n=1 Tax=Halopelagius longus TaxID=1236180 RepID=A0A1H1G0X5_9EURY|nr:MarR family transcriptional regulator [Halopelagius longus]SDR06496.1 Predicted transcriptional regulator, contains HTH domain [Halopelagius longus]
MTILYAFKSSPLRPVVDGTPTSRDSSKLVEILAKRFEVLRALKDNPTTQTELSERMDISRPTVHRIIETFEEQRLVQRRESDYELTEFGREVCESHSEYVERIDNLSRLETIKRELGDELSFDSPILEGAEVRLNDPYTVDSPGCKNRQVIENAVKVCTVLDGVMFDYLDTHRTETNNEAVIMVLSDNITDSVLNTYEEPARDLLRTDYFELYRTSEPFHSRSPSPRRPIRRGRFCSATPKEALRNNCSPRFRPRRAVGRPPASRRRSERKSLTLSCLEATEARVRNGCRRLVDAPRCSM